MIDALRPFQEASAADQAARFHARERRRSLAGILELHRTHRIFGGTAMAVASIATGDVFPDRERPITFRTAVRFAAGLQAGMVFEFGSSTRGCALAVAPNGLLAFVAGEGGNANSAAAVFDNGVTFPTGLELEIVAAIRPGDGRIRLWGNGRELARATAANGDFNGGWADDEAGSFAAASSGTQPAVFNPVAIAPFGFAVIEPLSAYVGQIPRHFV